MKTQFINIFKNFTYSLTSNLISLTISSLVVLIVPRIIGVEQYGYWQLYLFFSSYLGFFHFGWNDGIYLRYGGEEYEELNKSLFFSQFHLLAIIQIILGISVVIISCFMVDDSNRLFIWQMIAIELVIINLTTMLTFILQATNRIKDFAIITISNRMTYFLLLLLFLLSGVTNYKTLILSDLTGKTISLIFAIYICKDIVFRKISDFKIHFKEIILNIKIGIRLTFSYIADSLVIGIVRLGIENNWSIAIFGQVSLTLSISSMFTVFINALGLVIYPILRRINEKNLSNVYLILRDALMILTLGILIFYMPINTMLSSWLPQYAESLNYMAMLFPIIIYQSKKSLLIDTYMKALRLEKKMLQINTITVILSIILTFTTTIILNNLNLSVLSIVILMALRDMFSEFYLSKFLEMNVFKNIVYELTLIVIFIYTSWIINSWVSTLIYSVFYLSYVYIKRKDIKELINYITVNVK